MDIGDYVISGVKSGSAEFGSVGSKYGAKTVTQTEAQMPSHTHIQNPHNHTLINTKLYINSSALNEPVGGAGSSAYQWSSGFATATNQYTGGGQAMNNIQPTVAALLVIKT